MSLTLRIIQPSGPVDNEILMPRLDELRCQGVKLLGEPCSRSVHHPWNSAATHERVNQLVSALTCQSSHAILCARGGYGVSDLLDDLPWHIIAECTPKTVVGFSDITALHSALWTKLGWSGIHGPMPGSQRWRFDNLDVIQLLAFLRGEATSVELPVKQVRPAQSDSATGWAFGGCFSVLTNLLGTPYFPKSLSGAILFLEDVGESAGRILRYWQQWLQLGIVRGVRGIVWGTLTELTGPGALEELMREFQIRCPHIPLYVTDAFGHGSTNFPIKYGAKISIKHGLMTWSDD